MRGRIYIRSLDASLEEFRNAWKAVEQGKPVKRRAAISFTSLDAVRKILTPRRLELIRVIRREQPESLHLLARLIGRDFKNVQEDVQLLAEYGFVSLKKSRPISGHEVAAPIVPFEEIEFRIPV